MAHPPRLQRKPECLKKFGRPLPSLCVPSAQQTSTLDWIESSSLARPSSRQSSGSLFDFSARQTARTPSIWIRGKTYFEWSRIENRAIEALCAGQRMTHTLIEEQATNHSVKPNDPHGLEVMSSPIKRTALRERKLEINPEPFAIPLRATTPFPNLTLGLSLKDHAPVQLLVSRPRRDEASSRLEEGNFRFRFEQSLNGAERVSTRRNRCIEITLPLIDSRRFWMASWFGRWTAW